MEGRNLNTYFRVYLGLMFCYGVALTTVQAAVSTLVQERTAQEMPGRAGGLPSCAYAGLLPLGMAFVGPLSDLLPCAIS